MPAPTGFERSVRKNGEIALRHHGREVTVECQHLLARELGDDKEGNERT